ncbi:hypothetical protein RHSIM_Rhsim09G0214800 [Rhododendron simsii]|uniref:FAD-binding PCMH-type domain-containing protein n=1 Tax=Rhododendron simsii TaxID=118357 RepID=A0A834LF99_RHOSS|nr:hypothetical protein RHSIM_Rhsim09G0214800 [Rhododendron simsii]
MDTENEGFSFIFAFNYRDIMSLFVGLQRTQFSGYTFVVIFLCFGLQFSGFRCQFGRTSRPLETFLPDPKRNLLSAVHPLREYVGRDLTSASNFSGHTHRIPCRFFGSAPIFMQRNPMFSTINADDITKFKEILGEKKVVQDEEALLAANTDWMRKYKGSSNLLLQPRTTEEVYIFLSYEIIAACFTICCIRISFPLLERLFDKVEELSSEMTTRAKVIFGNEATVPSLDFGCFVSIRFVMPLNLGAKGSCQAGGNVSTNAGGLHFVRYGSLHGNVLGLEAVLANGTVIDMLGTLCKDNTGYDLKHLFIGSEGSLGIISKVFILTPPKLSSVNLAFFACKDYVSCQNLLPEAKRKLGNILSAFEFLDSYSMDLVSFLRKSSHVLLHCLFTLRVLCMEHVLNHLEGVRNHLPPSMHNFYALIETTESDQSYDK